MKKKLLSFLTVLTAITAVILCTALCVSAEGDIAVTRVVGENSQTQYTSVGTLTLWEAPAGLDGQFVGWSDGTALSARAASFADIFRHRSSAVRALTSHTKLSTTQTALRPAIPPTTASL